MSSFTFTEDKYSALLARLTALEESYNKIVIAIDKFITLNQLNELHTLSEFQIDELATLVASLRTRVETLEEEPILD